MLEYPPLSTANEQLLPEALSLFVDRLKGGENLSSGWSKLIPPGWSNRIPKLVRTGYGIVRSPSWA